MEYFTPVEIRIENGRRFAQIALVLDRPKVVAKILSLRDKYAIKEDYKSFLEWQKSAGELGIDAKLRHDIRLFRRGVRLSPNYDYILLKATVCNIIVDADFKLTELRPVSYYPGSTDNRDSVYAILLNPEASLEDVKNQFKKYKKDTKLSQEYGKRSYRYIPNLSKIITTDTFSEIKRNRDWYWQHMNGRKPLEIARNVSSSEKGMMTDHEYRDTIKFSLRDYKKNLGR